MFELTADEFSYEYEGKIVQRRVQGTSSLSCTPKSKLYAWYCKLVGKELAEGEKIDLKSVVGMPCRLMVKNAKGKADDQGNVRIYSNVIKILTAKNVEAKPAVAAPKVEAPKAAAPVVETPAPAVQKPVEKPVEKPAPVVEPPKATSSDDDVFSDIF